MKRGESGLSLLVAIDKPRGMSSHDVVNRVRRVFGERRVGHTGTLDPLATGVLPICVGPATRLDRYMTGHDKRYRVEVAFGCETTTDDAEGEVTVTGSAPARLLDEGFAASYVAGLAGAHEQVPPQYSAVKVNGKRAYKLARSGDEAQLEARTIEVFESSLVGCCADGETGMPRWTIDLSVSKGTYIRALARDIGRDVGCPAHVASLQRLVAGAITLDDCVSLETLERLGTEAALDPIAVLGYRCAFCDEHVRAVESGMRLSDGALQLYDSPSLASGDAMRSCTNTLRVNSETPLDGEVISIIVGNRMKALYAYQANDRCWKPACVFSTGVLRG